MKPRQVPYCNTTNTETTLGSLPKTHTRDIILQRSYIISIEFVDDQLRNHMRRFRIG